MTLRKYIFLLSTFTIFSHASYTEIAKMAGITEYKMHHIIEKLIVIESATGAYNTINRRSGAYGKYQIMPYIAEYYADKLNIAFSTWKIPSNQDKIFYALLKDNIKKLKKYHYKITAFTIYGVHQQGFYGFQSITKNKKLSKYIERNIRENLPKKYKNIKKVYLKFVWVLYWKKRLS